MKKISVVIAIIVIGLLGWRLGAMKAKSDASASFSEPSAVAESAPSNTGAEQVANAPSHSDPTFHSPTQANSSRGSSSTGSGFDRMAPRPFESRLLTNNMVNDNAIQLLKVKNFDQAVNALDAENAGHYNPIADKYRAEVQDTIAKAGKQIQLDRFACGGNVCLASVRTPQGDASFNDWYKNLQPNSPIPIGALAGQDVQLPGGGIEHRILFTTQPGSAGFAIKPLPPGSKPG